MSACTQCGTVVKTSDKFCSVCGTPIARASASSEPPAYGNAATAYSPGQGGTPGGHEGAGPGAIAQPQPARCQLGHEVAPGANYCPQGHPVAIELPPFAHDGYGGGYHQPGAIPPYPAHRPAGGPYGTPAPPPSPYGPPPQQPYGSPAPSFSAPSPYGSPSHSPSAPYRGPPQPIPYAAFAPDLAQPPFPPKVLRGFLVAYGSNPSGDFWPLTAGRLTMGRSGTGEGLDIALHDPTISSRHGALVVDATSGTIAIEDTGSTNGTFVNDEHIGYGGRRELRDGDRIRLGGFTTVVKIIGRI
jgi:hypothetical protein